MKNIRNPLLAVISAALLLAPAAHAGWMDFASSVMKASKNGQKHPEGLDQMLIVRRDSPGARICSTYLITGDSKGKGKVVTRAGIVHEDGSIDTLKFTSPVRDQMSVSCKAAGRLVEGDMVVFEFELKGMPRLKKGDTVEINGVVTTAGAPAIERYGLVPSGDGGWVHSANSVFVPEKDKQKHPAALERVMTMPRDAKRPLACTAYSRGSDRTKGGRIATTATILRVDGAQEKVNFAGRVRDGAYLKCKAIGNLAQGDAVEFDHKLKGMPRLRKESKKNFDVADIYGAISTCESAGASSSAAALACVAPEFQDPPDVTPDTPKDPPTPREPPDDGGGGGGGGNGALSEADYSMACATLVANRKTQIQRPRGDNPGKYLLLGPKSTADSSGTRADVRNTGVGNTIAAAAADYQKKTRDSLGNGCSLSSRDRAAIQWYHNMNASAGPTAIRRDSGGGYHADFWRPWAHVIQGGFGSVAAVVDFLKANRL